MLSQLGFEHDVACHRWEELFDTKMEAAIVSAPVLEPKPKPEPRREPAPATEEELAAQQALVNELTRLRRKNRIFATVCVLALLALPFACAL